MRKHDWKLCNNQAQCLRANVNTKHGAKRQRQAIIRVTRCIRQGREPNQVPVGETI